MRPVYLLGQEVTRDFAVSVNASRYGLCVVTNQDFTKGQKVVLYSKFLWPDKVMAEVVWCSDINDSIRRAGLLLCHQN